MFQNNISLKPYNSFGIHVNAKNFAAFNTPEILQTLLDEKPATDGLLILGGGSNILLTNDVNGLVLKNEIAGIEKVDETQDHVFVKAGAGVNWHQFVLYCITNNLGGVENLSLIPGCVGASPMQNIGAYGVEIKEVFYELEALHISDKKMVRFSLPDCAFGYRESVFKRQLKGEFIILNVTYKLTKKHIYNIGYGAVEHELEKMGVRELSVKAISDAIIRIRTSKLPDPKLIGNAGSFFKNPEVSNGQFDALKNNFPGIVGYPLEEEKTKLAAGWLIEQSGWKGYRKGDAGVHVNQALVLVNYGAATGNEIYTLSEKIIQSVFEKFGVMLEREVNII